MADNQQNFAALIFGGIFLGAWVYGLLFGFPDPVSGRQVDWQVGKWFFWGLLGMAIAGGLYAARVATDTVRMIIIVAVGVFLGVLILAALLEEEAYVLGTFVTATGAGLIAASIPRPGHHATE